MSNGNNSESQNTTEIENEVVLETQQQNKETIENEPPVITNQLTAGEKDLIEKVPTTLLIFLKEYKFPSVKSENKKLLKENTKKKKLTDYYHIY